MCERHIYSRVKSQGNTVSSSTTQLCPNSHLGHQCHNTKEFRHPVGERQPSHTRAVFHDMPPSPPSSVGSFEVSGNESRSHKRRPAIYINSQRVLDINHKPSNRKRGYKDREYTIVDPPAHSPPRQYDHGIYEPQSQEYHVRPAVKVEVNDRRSRRGNTYSHSYSSSSSEEDRRVRKLERELEKAKAAARIREVIDRHNEAIDSRPPVPSAPRPATYLRPVVAVDGLVDAMRHVTIADIEKDRRRQLDKAEARRQREEDAAQKQRLAERMAPKPQRRNSISGGYPRQREKFVDEYGRPYYLRV